MSLLYFFAATTMEARALWRIPALARTRSRETGKIVGTIGPNRVELVVTGIGPAAARAAAVRAAGTLRSRPTDQRASGFFVIGTCGSLSPDLAEGSIVIYNACLSAATTRPGMQENSRIESPANLVRGIAAALASKGVNYELATGITSSRVALRPSDKLQLAERRASVVDMESYEIVTAARTAGIPCVVLRVVSDSLRRKLPDFTPAIKPNGKIDTLAAASIALRAPISTARFMAVNRRVLARLRSALEAILTTDCFAAS